MVNTFIPALRTCFEAEGIGQKEGTGADLIIVVHGRVYELGEHFEWSPDVNQVYAIGSGASYALGSLYTNLKKNSLTQAQASVRQALEVSAQLDPYTGSPFTIVTQKA